MKLFKFLSSLKIVIIVVLSISYNNSFSQQTKKTVTIPKDSSKANVTYNKEVDGNLFKRDTNSINNEISPLDIGSNRGLYILSQDKMMQMRIMGSVRALLNYTNELMDDQISFNPYDIPTSNSSKSPNFFASIAKTRLGFEVTRRTEKIGDIFIRIEADFTGTNGTFKIRHAYGQIKHFLVGQTWSMFSNVSFLPATVSSIGPVGAITLRTPQLRYSKVVNKNLNWVAGIEYSTPDLDVPDSLNVTLLQVIPDLTGKIVYSKNKFSGQFSGIITTISGKSETDDNISYSFGIGGTLAGKFKFNKKSTVYGSFTSGTGMSHFINIFMGKGEDAVYNPTDESISSTFSIGGFLSYERVLPYNLSAYLSAGAASLSTKYFEPDDAFNWAGESMLDVFWKPVEGARMGLEYAHGIRVNKDLSRHFAGRFSILIYYDF
jgi:hypothetical protein